MDILKLLSGCGLMFLGQILVWFQLYGPLKIDWLKGNNIFIYGTAIPITMLFYYAIRLTTQAFDGSMWPSRFLTFTLGIFSFTFLTWYFNGEGVNIKTGICLLLAFTIIMIQVFWK